MRLLWLFDWAERVREMCHKLRDAFNKIGIIGSIAIAAGCVTVVSFVLYEMRRPDELKRDEAQMERITTAISEVVGVTRNANSNESARIQAQEKATTSLEVKSTTQQMWSATARVSGAKNVIKFVSSSGNEGVPRIIGGTKTTKLVPIPENCQLTIQVAGVNNKILIDEKLRGHVSVSGSGVGCSVSWVSDCK